MATLKGQNLRVLTVGEGSALVVGMATNCTITLTNNTDDGSTKDDVGMASLPITVSKAWTVQVDSLNVADAGAMLTAIKNMTPFVLAWDEVSTTDNQTVESATFQRVGTAYINDLTLTFNDRENSAKNIQFTGVGAISHDTTLSSGTVAAGSYTKGQFVRLFLSADNSAAPASVVGAAKQLSLHVSMTLEDATTKDTEGEWQIQEPVALSYDISTNALVRSGDTITSTVTAKGLSDLETIYEAGTPVKWKIANVGGANNRTASSTIVSGSAVLTQLTINAPNRQNATYTAQLNGYGTYTVGA